MLTHSHFFFFFNDTATTEIYTLSLHDALPICRSRREASKMVSPLSILKSISGHGENLTLTPHFSAIRVAISSRDRKSTRLLQSPDHLVCRLLLEKKKKTIIKQDSDTASQP